MPMTEAHQRTLTIAEALAARLTYDQLDAIRVDLDCNWCDNDGLINVDAPSGAAVLLFALSDAVALKA